MVRIHQGASQKTSLSLAFSAFSITLELDRRSVVNADPLVFGELGVKEARCSLACSRYLIKLDAKRLARSATRYAQELQVVALFNKCRRYGVEGPLALEDLTNSKLLGWRGNPHELIQDHTGQWRWGDGVPR